MCLRQASERHQARIQSVLAGRVLVVMFGRENTRDVALQARDLITAHIEECREARREAQRFQRWVMGGIITVLLTVLGGIVLPGIHVHFGG